MISCANHDYVEIACMYGFQVKLVLKDGYIFQGKAIETTYNQNKQECIVLQTEAGIQENILDNIASMEAVTDNPHFEKIVFG